MLFLALMIIIQLNIFATRTPSLWWRFSDSTAPRPSVYLVIPVGAVLCVATFIAVYWPEQVQPDGGRGVLIGAGDGMPGVVHVTSMCDRTGPVFMIGDAGLVSYCVQEGRSPHAFGKKCTRCSSDIAKMAPSLLSPKSSIRRLGQSRHHLGLCHCGLAAS